MIMSCFVAVESSRKYIHHIVSKRAIWKNPLFWDSCFKTAVEKQLIKLYEVECPSDLEKVRFNELEQQEKMDAEEERVIFQQVRWWC